MKEKKKTEISFYAIMFTFFRMSVLFMAVVAIFVLAKSQLAFNFNTSELEAELYFQAIYYSPHGFSYIDSAGRAHPGIVDLDKIRKPGFQKEFDSSFNYTKTIAAARITITYNNKKTTFYSHKEEYKEWDVLKRTGILGLGSVTEIKKQVPVVVMENGRKINGMLTASIIVPNS